jgi:dethiobiotin synthetase
MTQRYFITGTDTAVGKTRVTCALLAAGRQTGHAVAGMKPVSAGLVERDGRVINEDVADILHVSGQNDPLEDINPFALNLPVSPHIAAKRANIAIDIAIITGAAGRLATGRELLLIEGAGGWHSPIAEAASMADIAHALGAPVLLVVGLKLGCLNHARLTLDAIRASGLPFAGWVASEIDPKMLEKDENMRALVRIFGQAALFSLPYSADVSADAGRAAPALAHLLA